MPKTDIRGSETVTVGGRSAVVVKVERSWDKAARRGRRTFLVRFGDGSERRVGRSSVVKGAKP